MGDAELRRLRGSLVSYVPQDPASSLNPALRIGTQLREVLEAHGQTDDEKNAARMAEMMREVALDDDPAYLKRYPHQLSGGQQQRIGLAMAFANRPRLIVLDEPTTGLDVTTQSTVLATVRELAAAHGVAALYVTHDLAVVAAVATRVAVMYAGRIVELGPADQLFESSGHPYTRRLVGAIPRLAGGRSLVGIPGHAPSPGEAAGRAAPSRRAAACASTSARSPCPHAGPARPGPQRSLHQGPRGGHLRAGGVRRSGRAAAGRDRSTGPQPRERRGLLRRPRGAALDQHDARAG